jgi:hypothetical protein
VQCHPTPVFVTTESLLLLPAVTAAIDDADAASTDTTDVVPMRSSMPFTFSIRGFRKARSDPSGLTAPSGAG